MDGVDAEQVRQRDPLRADGACRRLRTMNAQRDPAAIVTALRELTPPADVLAGFDDADCLAAMRDLGLFLGSLKRLGVEPVDAVPGLEPVLLRLGERTDMVPRDTLMHYVAWSPVDGRRARMYTGEPQESLMKASVRLGLPGWTRLVHLCTRLRGWRAEDPRTVTGLAELTAELRPLHDAIRLVSERVTPEFFARTLRPYFEPVRVAGRSFHGPAAAHVPLPLVDLTLWGSDHADARCRQFWRESAPYSMPAWRGRFEAWMSGTSLVTRVAAAVSRDGAQSTRPVVAALAAALRSLVVFRGRHLRVARLAYDEEVRLHPRGSGGASVDLLTDVLTLTRENLSLIRRSLPGGVDGGGPPVDRPAHTHVWQWTS